MATDTTIDLNNYREQYSYYARQLLTDLGLAQVGQPERSQLLMAIEHYVENVMVNTLLENLTPEQLEQAERILDRGGDQEAVIVHLLSTTPGIGEKMSEAMTQTYARMLTECQQLSAAIVKKAPAAEPATTGGENDGIAA